MDHAVIFVCIWMQVSAVLRYIYIYDVVTITIFKIKHKLHTALGSAPPPMKFLCVHLECKKCTVTSYYCNFTCEWRGHELHDEMQ